MRALATSTAPTAWAAVGMAPAFLQIASLKDYLISGLIPPPNGIEYVSMKTYIFFGLH